MKIFSWNVNGLRSVYRQGFLSWLKIIDPDILCLQEIKAQQEQLPDELLNATGFKSFFSTAVKKGYSGLAVYSKTRPVKAVSQMGWQKFDQEGRFLRLDFAGWALINLYLPHGGRGKEKLDYKLESYRRLNLYLKKQRKKKIILAGDFNVAHTEKDLARPKQNQNNIMFTPEERACLDRLVALGYSDSFRFFNQGIGYYTWWPFFPKDARKRNLGWRLDYIFTSKILKPNLKSSEILSATKGSDHCPVMVDLEL